MMKLLITMLFMQFVSFAFAQNTIKRYVEQNAIRVSSIQPDATNFQDLERIGKAIGDSKIVMLGEQDHGDAPTYLAKTRLIKYLHENMGFNVLAFEGDFFSLNYGWSALEKNKSSIDSFIMQNIYSVWSRCNTCDDLIHTYLPATYKTSSPLTIAGFDNQMTTSYSQRTLVVKLDSMMRFLDLPVTNQPNYHHIMSTLDSLQYAPFARKDTSYFDTCKSFLKQIKTEFRQILEKDDFWSIVVDNLIQEVNQFDRRSTYVKSNNVRDHQMANNLQWLSETRFSQEKIIVWAANEHVAKYRDKSLTGTGEERITMGSYFTADSSLEKKSYIIGFTSYSGTAGRINLNTYKINLPMPNSFEKWINRKSNYSFVDFKTFSGDRQQFYMKALGHNVILKEDWTGIFDGIFYIKDMYPCERILKTIK